jgi:hypothetical protein
MTILGMASFISGAVAMEKELFPNDFCALVQSGGIFFDVACLLYCGGPG